MLLPAEGFFFRLYAVVSTTFVFVSICSNFFLPLFTGDREAREQCLFLQRLTGYLGTSTIHLSVKNRALARWKSVWEIQSTHVVQSFFCRRIVQYCSFIMINSSKKPLLAFKGSQKKHNQAFKDDLKVITKGQNSVDDCRKTSYWLYWSSHAWTSGRYWAHLRPSTIYQRQ